MKRNSTAAILRRIQSAHCPLYTLEDVAEQFACLGAETVSDIFSGVGGQIQATFKEAEAMLPKGHEAAQYLKKARERLSDAAALTRLVLGGQSTTNDEDRALGRALLAAVSAAGRFMECAEHSLGDYGLCGWLDGLMHVDGAEEKYIRVYGPRDFAWLNLMGTLSPENKQRAHALIGELAKSQQ